ncbi:Crp/Fnr family transcriptional regulator [Spirochaeta cellobiosiphila]|uniref:Crp/Fnr family transcriptional regulator n=1 Tax=Spirochaeta cellobiosiphila TaxID=504483 RepID=UPI00041B911B|nr:cyclic nucleotide-binding domain-containing protein [Spirochaeta cellobiosiphila]
MKLIRDSGAIEDIMEQHNVLKHLYDKQYPLNYCHFSKGEYIVNPVENLENLLFIHSGSIKLFGIREDSSEYAVCHSDQFTLLGELELITGAQTILWVEALSDVACVSLSFQYKEALMEDVVFLRYLVQVQSRKFYELSQSIFTHQKLEDRLIHYILSECEDLILDNLQAAQFQLHCSRRQLQRVLKALVLDQKLRKVGRGQYQWNENSPSHPFSLEG